MKRVTFEKLISALHPALCTLLCAGLVFLTLNPAVQENTDLPLPDGQVSGVSVFVADALAYEHPETERPGVYAGRNVLVIVPHQDDEVCILGGVFERYIAEGSRVRVLFTTNGDYAGGTSTESRMQEAINAMAVAGIPAEDILFLGFGDQWKTSHIYHEAGDAVITSHAGYKETYSTTTHDVWKENVPYTRNNYKAGLKDIIQTLHPDTIFCIDFDGHQDHRALSLLFEEAMGEMLRDDPAYTPTVFKGFGYSLSWVAPFDFYSSNILSTVNPTDVPYMTEVNYYDWDARVRFPVAKEALARIKAPSTTHKMLRAYISQEAPGRANCVLNGDRVFWHRPTKSVLYRATFSASSGDTAVLNDFRYIDCTNITNPYPGFADYLWTPDADDTEKTVTVSLEDATILSEIRLFDCRSLDNNILKAEITFDNGSSCLVNDLPCNGAPAIIPVDQSTPIQSFTVRILESEGSRAGLSEIEAYKESPNHDLHYIKLMNESGDFVYDYWLQDGDSERFVLYGCNMKTDTLADSFSLTVEGDDGCSAFFDNNGLIVNCPTGHNMTLTIRSETNPTLSDAVHISNPSNIWRGFVQLLQYYENIAGKVILRCELAKMKFLPPA